MPLLALCQFRSLSVPSKHRNYRWAATSPWHLGAFWWWNSVLYVHIASTLTRAISLPSHTKFSSLAVCWAECLFYLLFSIAPQSPKLFSLPLRDGGLSPKIMAFPEAGSFEFQYLPGSRFLSNWPPHGCSAQEESAIGEGRAEGTSGQPRKIRAIREEKLRCWPLPTAVLSANLTMSWFWSPQRQSG